FRCWCGEDVTASNGRCSSNLPCGGTIRHPCVRLISSEVRWYCNIINDGSIEEQASVKVPGRIPGKYGQKTMCSNRRAKWKIDWGCTWTAIDSRVDARD